MPKVICASRKIRWMNTIIICCKTINSPAQAASRPTVLANHSSPRTTPHNTELRHTPMIVSTKNAAMATKNNSAEAP